MPGVGLCWLAFSALLGGLAPSVSHGAWPNLLVNAGFEYGTEGWYVPTGGPLPPISGEPNRGWGALQFRVDPVHPQELTQKVAVQAGADYSVFGYMRTSKLDRGAASVRVDWRSSNGRLLRSDIAGEFRGTHVWKSFLAVLRAPAQALIAEVVLRCDADSTGVGAAWFDDLEFRGPPSPARFAGLSAYLGGGGDETVRDAFVDGSGYLYLTGGTASADFPVTAGAYATQFNPGGANPHDVFVTKLRPDGTIVWSTYLGGPNYDRAYAIEVDDLGCVYVGGRAGAGFPTTAGVLQPDFAGDVSPNALYGPQDGFVAKLSPDGSQLLWATYFGAADRSFIRDIALDSAGQVHLALTQVTAPVAHITPGAFQTQPQGNEDGVVAKLSADGTRVLWATYLGGSGFDMGTPSIRVNFFGQVYVLGTTESPDIPTTGGAFDRTFNGVLDMYLAKLDATGSQLLFATYFGGSDVEFSETHGLALDEQGNACVAATTRSADLPTTVGAFQRVYGGSGGLGSGAGTNYPGDGFIAKFAATSGQLLAATYLGGSAGEGLEGVGVSTDGSVFVGGSSFSDDFPVSADAAQGIHRGSADLIAAKLTADLRTLVYSTYFGGSGTDFGRSEAMDASGNLLVVGHSQSTDFPVMIGFPNHAHGGIDGVFAQVVLAGYCTTWGAPCDDDDACTVLDACDGQGQCVGQAVAGCESCTTNEDCDDGIACTSNQCTDGVCLYVSECPDDGNLCNGMEVCDSISGGCVHTGDPCPGVCNPQSGCPCQTPVVTAGGGRYLTVKLLPLASSVPTDLRVTSATQPCLDRYAGAPVPFDIDGDGVADGGLAFLVDDPGERAVLTPAQWGQTVFLADRYIIPSDVIDGVWIPSAYTVVADCGAFQASATTTMPRWGDVNANDFVNVQDVQMIVAVFFGSFNALGGRTLPSTDLAGLTLCHADQRVSVVDIQRAVLAFAGQSYRAAAAFPECALCP